MLSLRFAFVPLELGRASRSEETRNDREDGVRKTSKSERVDVVE